MFLQIGHIFLLAREVYMDYPKYWCSTWS